MGKPSRAEEEFIARQEAITKHRLAVDKGRQIATDERERRRVAHYMKCPKCGMDLTTITYRGVAIDRCYECHGTWLDAGELEQLAGHGGDVLSRIIALFRPDLGDGAPKK